MVKIVSENKTFCKAFRGQLNISVHIYLFVDLVVLPIFAVQSCRQFLVVFQISSENNKVFGQLYTLEDLVFMIIILFF